jgi:ABC-type spermidine/putrescine transport system permease subunit I
MKTNFSKFTENVINFLEKHAQLRYFVLLVPALVLIVFFFVLPLFFTLRISFYESSPVLAYIPGFTVQSYVKFFQEPYYLSRLWVSFQLGFITSIVTLLLSYPIAYIIWRGGRGRRTILLSCIIFSLFVNIVIRAYGWLIILGRFGMLSYIIQFFKISDTPVSFAYSFPAVIIGLTQECLPYMVLSLVAVLRSIDWTLVEAARNLGAGRLRSIYEVVFPLSMPGVLAATSLGFIWGVGSFVIPSILGSEAQRTLVMTAETKILRVFDWPLGAAITIILAFFVLITLIFYHKFTRRGAHK